MPNQEVIKQIIREQQSIRLPENPVVREINTEFEPLKHNTQIIIIKGLRRCGKSTFMQWVRSYEKKSHFYFNFDDDRLSDFTLADFELLLELFVELYGVEKTQSQKINKKMYKRALRSIISELHRSGNLIVVENFELETPKTKDFLALMMSYELNNALIIVDELSENEYLGSRNLINYEVTDVVTMDPVSLLRFEKVLITKAAIADLVEVLQ